MTKKRKSFFPKSVLSKPIYLVNDALAQCIGQFVEYHQQSRIDEQLLVFLGIGTGLGGGLAYLNGETLILLEDSHIFDFPIQHKKTKAFVNAERIISGSALSKMTQQSAEALLTTDRLFEKFEPQIDFMIDHLGLLMNELSSHMRRLFHTEAKISFLIGGSIGTNPKIAQKIQSKIVFDTHIAKNPDINAHIGNIAFQELLTPVTINVSNQ